MSPALVRALRGLRTTGLCLSCLAATVGLSVEQTRDEMTTISEVIKVVFRLEPCARCSQRKTVVRAI